VRFAINDFEMKMRMKGLIYTLSIVFALAIFAPGESYAQTGWNGYTCDNCIPCGPGLGPCCSVWKACNGPGSPYNTYEAGNGSDGSPAVNGCDMACTPIDSGVLFLLLGGAAFGGLMLMRNRRHELTLVQERS